MGSGNPEKAGYQCSQPKKTCMAQVYLTGKSAENIPALTKDYEQEDQKKQIEYIGSIDDFGQYQQQATDKKQYEYFFPVANHFIPLLELRRRVLVASASGQREKGGAQSPAYKVPGRVH